MPSATEWPAGPVAPEDIRFLEGPQPRGFELLRSSSCEGFAPRFGEHPPYQPHGSRGGRRAGPGGLYGRHRRGAPGIVEAANRDAREGGGRSLGCTIELPQPQKPNAYLDR